MVFVFCLFVYLTKDSEQTKLPRGAYRKERKRRKGKEEKFLDASFFQNKLLKALSCDWGFNVGRIPVG